MKKFITGLFTICTVIISFTWLASTFTYYISPLVFWPMAFLALGSPYLAICMLVLLLTWLFIKRKVAVIMLLLLLAGFHNLYSTVAVNIPSQKHAAKKDHALRLLSWNVRGFDNPSISADSAMGIRRQMFTYLKKANADVLCFQEFIEHKGESFLSNTRELADLGYTYYYKTNDQRHFYYWGSIENSVGIFSRFPIADSGKVLLGDPSFPEYIAYVDVMLENKPLRIFSAHFKSLNLFAQVADPNNKAFFHGDSNFVYEASKLEKLKVFAQDHAREASIAKAELNKSPYPVVFMADMNSVPASYAYHTMAKGLQDAFLQKGFGVGTTLDSLPKTLRIDFILADKTLLIQRFQKDELHLSDHFPQYVDLLWKK